MPMAIRIESAGYFTCELQFQLVNDRHWMLKDVTSWFDVANKSCGVVCDVQVDQASELWNQTKVQLDTTQSLFSQKDVVVEPSKESQATISTTPQTFGKWVTADRVKEMLTLPSTSKMELKLQSADNLESTTLPVMLLDKSSRTLSSGGVQLQQDGSLWKGSMKVSAMNATDVASIAIATQQGQVKQQIDVVALVPNKAQAVNMPDSANGKTCVARIELSRGDSENPIIRLRVVSINGPQEFPVTTNVELFDEQSKIVVCGEQSQSIRVDGGPSVNDLTFEIGMLQKFSNVRYAAISVRNGEAPSAPMGSFWASSVGIPEVVVPTEALLAAADTLCHQIAVQHLIEKLSDCVTDSEMFGDSRDHDRAVKRKQLRSDIVKPHAEALAGVLGSDASESLKQDAAKLLGHSGDQSRAAVLFPLLESSAEQTRDIAAISFGMLGNEAGFSSLESILRITSPLIDATILKTEGPDWKKKRDAWAASRPW